MTGEISISTIAAWDETGTLTFHNPESPFVEYVTTTTQNSKDAEQVIRKIARLYGLLPRFGKDQTELLWARFIMLT